VSASAARRAVVTGLGLVTPLGLGREPTWDALIAGRSGIGPVTRFDAVDFPSRIAGEVRGFDPAAVVGRRDAGTFDLFVLYAIAAALEAAADAGLAPGPLAEPDRVGVCFGVGLGGIGSMERNLETLRDRGPRRVSPFLVPMMIPNMAASHVSIRLGARGPCEVVATACASGAHALAAARRWIADGLADVVVAGGAEAAVTPLSFAGFCSMRALSRRNDDPAAACRPFDAGRDGFVLAEGAAALVLEAAEAAARRGARVYAELAGAASTADAFHITQPDPEGRGQARCMTLALADALVAPREVGYVNAHGTGTEQNDRAEAGAILTALGDDLGRAVPVSSTKSMTGHLLGAAGALEAAICALTIERGVIPPTINLDQPDPACPLAHVARRAVERPVDVAMSNSFGFGGTNATLVLRRWE
jgi:3-oxoacyl-[acyl-carrier-protein] synthase II